MSAQKVPVLFLTFNRLTTTKLVFARIKSYQPEKLYLASDGSRFNKPGEAALVAEVREFLLNQIDWKCEVKSLFRESNLGCKNAVSSAISWFFENEEMGIILEDDCLPAQSFFDYSAFFLNKYKHDERIMQISGVNFAGVYPDAGSGYLFSRFGGIWGWASWRRSWEKFSLDPFLYQEAKKTGILKGFLGKAYSSRMAVFEQVFEKGLDTWDYQWSFARTINSGLSVVPAKNLVSNIGFGTDATHTTTSSSMSEKEIYEIDTNQLKDNPFIVPDERYDAILLKQVNGRFFFVRQIYRKIKKTISALTKTGNK